MPDYKVLIADDDSQALRHARGLLSVEPGCDVVGECSNAADALRAVGRERPDILILGVQLPDMDGFELARALPDPRVITIFTALGDEYAVKAFEVHAFDYLVKPLDPNRFRSSLRRAVARVEQDRGPQQTVRDRVAVRNNGRVVLVKLDDIDWVEASDNYVCLHAGRETHVIRETMNELELRLDGTRFVRVHRSAIVNLDRIRELQPWFRGDYRVILRDGTELTLTRSHRNKLESRLLLGAGAR